MSAVTELAFEAAIEAWLVDHAGYEKADNTLFDAELALDSQTLLAFIKATQDKTWQELSASYGGKVENSVVKRIAAECDSRGLLDVVRRGARDRGQTIQQTIHLAYFKPARTAEDKLPLEQISGDMAKDERLAEQARANPKEKFKEVSELKAMEAFVLRHERNEKIINEFMSNHGARSLIVVALLDEVYGRATKNDIGKK